MACLPLHLSIGLARNVNYRFLPPADGLIAATERRHNLTVSTGNDKDFRRAGVGPGHSSEERFAQLGRGTADLAWAGAT